MSEDPTELAELKQELRIRATTCEIDTEGKCAVEIIHEWQDLTRRLLRERISARRRGEELEGENRLLCAKVRELEEQENAGRLVE